ncbi:hypothetical protein RND71_032906 [Anisodus tanguticus]|uniref:LOB domain-containing protein n=1 Tax=Anisodus tanguticus TaxID=243964 RepID=A0AAE1UX13_9SOLA|nr:hypothetical protein RND71_032906 [Anisodus tanguticus]
MELAGKAKTEIVGGPTYDIYHIIGLSELRFENGAALLIPNTEQPKRFQNAHRLFRVRNIMRILEQLDDEDQKADAMKSLIFDSDMREKFPIYGCVECISYLRQ